MDSNLLWGVVDMLILDVLTRGPSYGYEIAQTVTSRSKGTFALKEGSLYPALHRLERKKLLAPKWERTEAGRRRKYYRLTAAGRHVLEAKRKEWLDFAGGVEGVLGASWATG